MAIGIGRRQFISAVGGAAIAWPLDVRAQQSERVRRVGLLTSMAPDSAITQSRIGAFLNKLQELGWTVGRNMLIDYRWAEGDPDRVRQYATELVALAPDLIVTQGGSHVAALQHATHAVPIVFVYVTDPVGGGLVESLARPGGNATGFTQFEYGISGKWVELLKQIAPGVKRVAILRNSTAAGGIGQFAAIQSVAPSFGVELTPIDMHDASEMRRTLTAFADLPGGALIVTSNTLAGNHRDLILAIALQYRLPAVYPSRLSSAGGGLISYGPDPIDEYLQAAGYVDRILKGEKPADLPVQAPTKYELVINLKTAKALGLDVPAQLLARADEVIE